MIHFISRHVNSHFEEDELDRDRELAQQVAMAPPSPNNVISFLFLLLMFQGKAESLITHKFVR